MRERGDLQELEIDWRIILKWIFRSLDEDMDWICLAHDKDRWRDFVNALMNIRGSVTCWKIHNEVRTCQLFTSGSAPWSYLKSISVTDYMRACFDRMS
jgi:hypothetical protein